MTPLLGSEDPPLPHFLQLGARPVSIAATKQVLLTIFLPTLWCDESSHLQIPQVDRMPNPQQPASSNTAAHPLPMMESKSSRVALQEQTTHAQSNSLASSTLPPNPPGIESLSDLPSVREVPRSSQQGPTADATPPGRSYTDSTADHVEAQIPNEPVEADAMSRQLSRTTLPPYSPGGFLRDGDVPSLPGR